MCVKLDIMKVKEIGRDLSIIFCFYFQEWIQFYINIIPAEFNNQGYGRFGTKSSFHNFQAIKKSLRSSIPFFQFK